MAYVTVDDGAVTFQESDAILWEPNYSSIVAAFHKRMTFVLQNSMAVEYYGLLSESIVGQDCDGNNARGMIAILLNQLYTFITVLQDYGGWCNADGSQPYSGPKLVSPAMVWSEFCKPCNWKGIMDDFREVLQALRYKLVLESTTLYGRKDKRTSEQTDLYILYVPPYPYWIVDGLMPTDIVLVPAVVDGPTITYDSPTSVLLRSTSSGTSGVYKFIQEPPGDQLAIIDNAAGCITCRPKHLVKLWLYPGLFLDLGTHVKITVEIKVKGWVTQGVLPIDINAGTITVAQYDNDTLNECGATDLLDDDVTVDTDYSSDTTVFTSDIIVPVPTEDTYLGIDFRAGSYDVSLSPSRHDLGISPPYHMFAIDPTPTPKFSYGWVTTVTLAPYTP